jgi:hypothetical protein
MRIPLLSASLLVLCPLPACAGPFDPAAGQPGSLAVAATDPAITAWATGFVNYLPGPGVDPAFRTPERALGPGGFTVDPVTGQPRDPIFDVVSLGNGGSITLTFDGTIFDGPGWDFAVFENAFNDTFLELARVQVSSDGVQFSPFFPAFSCTPGPVGAFGSVDPTHLHGFAGKYRAGFGTAFDLAVFAQVPGIDVSAIRQVRIVDVIGDGSMFDDQPAGVGLCGDGRTGPRPIFDPHPTVGSAGFDLEAVAVRHLNAAPPPPPPAPVRVPLPAGLSLALALLLLAHGLRSLPAPHAVSLPFPSRVRP